MCWLGVYFALWQAFVTWCSYSKETHLSSRGLAVRRKRHFTSKALKGWKQAHSERTKAGFFYQKHKQIREPVDAIHGHRLNLYTSVWMYTLSTLCCNLWRSQWWLCGGLKAPEPILCICRQPWVEADWGELVGWFITGLEHWNARRGGRVCLRCSQCDGELYWFGVCAHNEVVVVRLRWTLVLPGRPPAAFSPTIWLLRENSQDAEKPKEDDNVLCKMIIKRDFGK